LAYVFHQKKDDPAVFVAYERGESDEAFKQHGQNLRARAPASGRARRALRSSARRDERCRTDPMIRNLCSRSSILLALALCEWLLRVFGAEVLPQPDLYLTDPDVGKRMRPGWEGSEFEGPVKINSKGLRNPETPYEKPEGVYRIVALGDSWTFGFRMNEPDAYPRQLERN
jgi:hypothetical protein